MALKSNLCSPLDVPKIDPEALVDVHVLGHSSILGF